MLALIILFLYPCNIIIRADQYFGNEINCNPAPIQPEPIYISQQFQGPFQQPISLGPAVPFVTIPQQVNNPVQRIPPSYPNGNIIYVVPIPYTSNNENGNKKIPIDWSEDKQGECPPERKRPCFKNSPYRGCENDFDCDDVQKCCFDYCLEQLVCKPPVKK